MAKTAGYAIPGNLTISNSGTYVIVQNANNQFGPTSTVTVSGGSHFETFGNTVTVGGISGSGYIENTENADRDRQRHAGGQQRRGIAPTAATSATATAAAARWRWSKTASAR